MKVTTERLEDCQVNVIIEMDAAEIEQKLRKTARTISRDFNVPGYRRGRAPYHTVIRVFGREAVQQEAFDEFGQELYEKALEEVEYDPYQPGELQEVEWDPFRMTVLLPIRPEVDLGDYRAVRVPYEPEPVTEEQIDEFLVDTQQEHAQWVPVERPAALGDQVVIDAEGRIGDQVVLSNEAHEMRLDADADHPLPGFHEQIVGVSPGGEKTFTLTYPEDDFEEDVAGKEATFTVALQSVKEEDLPPLDDDLAMMVGDYDTLDELKASVRERMETEAAGRAEAEYLDKVLDAMIEAATRIEYPPAAVDNEADLALDQMGRNLASSGIELDTYLEMLGTTREVYKQELRPAAEDRLKKRLVLSHVAEQEGLEPEPSAIEDQISQMSEAMGEQSDAMREVLNSPGGRLSVASDLTVSLAQERVVLIGKGEAPPLEDDGEADADDEAGAETETEGETEDEIESGVEAEAGESAPVSAPKTEETGAAVTSEQPASESAESSEEEKTEPADESEDRASE
jgi:trigger factor